jgi:ribosomal protein L6P/L9E
VTIISKTPSRPATPGRNFQRLLIRGNGIKKYVRLPAGILCLPGTRSWKKGKAGIVTKIPELTLSNAFFKRFERPERDTRLFKNALVSLYDPSQGLVNFSCSSLNAAGLALVRVDRVGCQFSTRETAALASLHGTAWQLLKAILQGISQPFEIGLHLRGIGFRARCCRGGIELRLGYSHPLFVFLPQDISVEVGKLTEITIKGVDKCRLGRFAATLRSLRLPDGYKGKGIYYRGERVKTRDGKTGKK